MNEEQTQKRRTFPWILAIILILLLVIGWHLIIFPLLGLTLVVTASAWGIIVATITVLSVAILFFFIFSGIGVLILGIFAFIWTVLAIALFPIIFPLVIPLLIILLFVGFLLRKRH